MWLVRAGYIPQNGPSSFGEYGVYRSSTVGDNSVQYQAYVYVSVVKNDGFLPTGFSYGSKSSGRSIRCVAE